MESITAYVAGTLGGLIIGIAVVKHDAVEYYTEESTYICYGEDDTIPINDTTRQAERVPSADESKICFRSEKLDK